MELHYLNHYRPELKRTNKFPSSPPSSPLVGISNSIMMNGLSATTNCNDVKYPPNVANSRGLSAAELEVDKLYEPKQNKKIVRIFTVILYMFSVSLGAILLSLYYVFLWKNPHTQAVNRRVRSLKTIHKLC